MTIQITIDERQNNDSMRYYIYEALLKISSDVMQSNCLSLTLQLFSSLDRPQPPTNVHMNKCTTSRAEVSWTASIDNNDRVVEYVVFYNTSHDPTGSYHVGSQTNTTTGTVHSLQPWTNYTFHVTARNSMGTSDPSHFTRVLCSTPQSRPSKSPAHVCTRNGKPGELVILWKVMMTELIVWQGKV